jgi:pyrroloquinoline-quinone synthase
MVSVLKMMSVDTYSEMTSTEREAVRLLAATPLIMNDWFTGLSLGTMSREDFSRSQRQFFFAVGFFSRALAALVVRLPGSEDREVLVHNLSEEHGLDEAEPVAGFRAHLAHDRTFLAFLESLGVTRSEMKREVARPAVQAFNLALYGACSMESQGFAFCALGIIEYAFSDISALIGRRVVEQGWVAADELVHYNLHAEIDKRHAAELFEAAERWEKCAEPSVAMLSGLKFGHHIFNRLYMDLLVEPT